MTSVPTYTIQDTTHTVDWDDGSRVVMHDPHQDRHEHYMAFTQVYSPTGNLTGQGHLRFLDPGDCTRFILRSAALNGATAVDWNSRLLLTAQCVHATLQEAALARRPDPLRRELPPPAPYPTHALGNLLQPMVKALMESIQAPDAICGQAVLAAVTLAVQGHADLTLDGRTFPLSQYLIDVGESGERRSAVDRIALAPHFTRERELVLQYAFDKRAYTNDLDVWKKERDNILKQQGGGKGKTSATETKVKLTVHGEAPLPPLDPVCIAEEPTYEGLIKLFLRGQPSLGLFSDEGGRFIGGHGMSADNQLKTITGLCELWDGKRISRVRATDETALLYGRRLSMHLMIQPIVAQEVLGNPLLLGQGFLSRCLTCWPTSTVGTRPYQAVALTQDHAVRAYNDRIADLLSAAFAVKDDQPNELDPRHLSLSLAAKALWVKFHDHVEVQLGEGAPLAGVRGFGNKAAEHAARLAGVLTLVDDLDAPEVDEDHMRAGITLAQFYVTEALRLFDASGVDPDVVLAEKLLVWAQEKEVMYLREVYQYGPGAIRDAATAKRIIAMLEDHGWLTRVIGGMELDGAQRRDVWRVHK